jgi:N-acetyl-anhydromuramyl-L-alanine amidase AmpD
LAGEGIGLWVEAPAVIGEGLSPGDRGDAVRALQMELAAFGFGIDPTGDYDGRTRDVVIAFQRHHRPTKFDGVIDAETRTILRGLLLAEGL